MDDGRKISRIFSWHCVLLVREYLLDNHIFVYFEARPHRAHAVVDQAEIKRGEGMREILFRGKEKQTNEWRYGFFWSRENESYIRAFDTHQCTDYKVIHETTGRKLGTYGNKVPIFAGDKLRLTFTDIYADELHYFEEDDEIKVVVEESEFLVELTRAGKDPIILCDYLLENCTVETIGTIHDEVSK